MLSERAGVSTYRLLKYMGPVEVDQLHAQRRLVHHFLVDVDLYGRVVREELLEERVGRGEGFVLVRRRRPHALLSRDESAVHVNGER